MQNSEASIGSSKTVDLSNCSTNPGIEEMKEAETKQGEDGNLNTKCRGDEKVSSNGEGQGERIEKLGEVVMDIDGDNNKSENDENQGMEKVCRICHLSDESTEIIQLGCDCKAELGVCHRHCAEAWFNQRGSRLCEICGKTTKNIKIREEESRITVMEWNQRAVQTRSSYTSNASATRNTPKLRCQQSCCNFLLACFVMAFTFPWFFRVNFP